MLRGSTPSLSGSLDGTVNESCGDDEHGNGHIQGETSDDGDQATHEEKHGNGTATGKEPLTLVDEHGCQD